MIFYTADTHFGHENVIKHDNRPFDSIEEMDETLISLWNSRVTDKDDIYIVGDIEFRSEHGPLYYLKRLKGKKHLVIGNHDTKLLSNPEAKKCFESIEQMAFINDNGRRVIACHYPMVEWNGYFRGAYHVYGHIHNNKNKANEIMSTLENAFNAGCMLNSYMPVTLDELIKNNKN